MGDPAATFRASRPPRIRLCEIGQPLPSSPRPLSRIARLPCDPHGVRRGLATALLFAGDAAIGDSAADKLSIIVEEWLINVVEHGEAAPGRRIALGLERRGDVVRLSVSDPGLAFDPREQVFEGPNLERGGGAGLAMINAWSRIVAYRRRAGRNRLVLEMPIT